MKTFIYYVSASGFWVITALWVAWLVGYPIYRKSKCQETLGTGSLYGEGLLLLCVLMNIFTLITHLTK